MTATVAPQETLGTEKISFTGKAPGDFARELKSRVDNYFTSRKLSPHANWQMVAKSVALLALTFVPYALILTNKFSPLAMLGLCFVMGIGMAGVGFAVSHDALHGAYSANPNVNRIIGMSFDVMGASGYMWRITHNVIHHTYTNIHGVDEDLDVSPLVRLSSGAPHRPFQRYQHFYAWFLYSMSTLFWVFVKDFKYFLARDIGPYKDKKHPKGEVALMAAAKLGHYAWSIVIPLLVVNVALWQFVIGYLAMHLTAGLILGVVFQLAHVVEGPDQVNLNPDGSVESAWMVHQFSTTANFATGNWLLTAYVGGLNYQVEHHLFPRVCSVHYPGITGILREVTKKYGVPYYVQPTLWSAVRSHYRTLKRLGQGATTLHD